MEKNQKLNLSRQFISVDMKLNNIVTTLEEDFQNLMSGSLQHIHKSLIQKNLRKEKPILFQVVRLQKT